MPRKREGPGRPETDDIEALRYVWRLRHENPRIGYREAARRYFQEHPERLGKTKLESAARRVGDKMARLRRVPRQAQRERLRWMVLMLYSIGNELGELLKRWDREAPDEGGEEVE